MRGRIKNSGWSLLELMVVVAIIGFLTSLLLPDASKQVYQARRAEAIQQLLTLQLAQEHHYLVYGHYADLNLLNTVPVNPHYRFQIADMSATSYTLIAQATTAGDGPCEILSLSHRDEKAPAECWR